MTVPIPYAMDYTVTVSGALIKKVHCKQCQTEYFYVLKRTAQGTGTSLLFIDKEGAQSRASSRATAELRMKLERGVELVPCPNCGLYQDNMIPRAQRQNLRWLLNLGACLSIGVLPIAFFAFLFSRDFQPISFLTIYGTPMLVGVMLMVLKVILSHRYDPNSQDLETRKKLGQSLAIPGEELAKFQGGESPEKVDEAITIRGEGPTSHQETFPNAPPKPRRPVSKPANGQLVGQSCVVCRKRVESVLEGRFCSGCGYAVHSKCIKLQPAPAGGSGCSLCGGDATESRF